MSTRVGAYDSAMYQGHFSVAGEAGGAATTAYNKFVAWTTLAAYSVTISSTVAGTAGTSTWQIQKVGTNGTTTYQLYTLATGAVGTGTSYLLSTSNGGVIVNPNEYLQVLSGGDATAKLAVCFELGLAIGQGAVTV